MKNYDPQMHTTEHILNQTMIRIFDCGRSFSMHLETKKSKCDYHFTRPLTADEETEIAMQVNRVIKQNLTVNESVVDIKAAAGLVSLDKLPDEVEDTVRLIKVGEYDTCACIGGHVSNTSEIGEFVLLSSSFENDVLRVRFKLNRPK
jgi:misacylated tRNA(Ala) deacylase